MDKQMVENYRMLRLTLELILRELEKPKLNESETKIKGLATSTLKTT